MSGRKREREESREGFEKVSMSGFVGKKGKKARFSNPPPLLSPNPLQRSWQDVHFSNDLTFREVKVIRILWNLGPAAAPVFSKSSPLEAMLVDWKGEKGGVV